MHKYFRGQSRGSTSLKSDKKIPEIKQKWVQRVKKSRTKWLNCCLPLLWRVKVGFGAGRNPQFASICFVAEGPYPWKTSQKRRKKEKGKREGEKRKEREKGKREGKKREEARRSEERRSEERTSKERTSEERTEKDTFHLKTGALQEGQNPASDPRSTLPLFFEGNSPGWTEFSFQKVLPK